MRGKEYSMSILDRGTGIKDSMALDAMDTDAAVKVFNEFRGDKDINLVYSDCADAISAACKIIRANSEHSQPGVPQTNGVVENLNSIILNGARVLLLQSVWRV